MPTSSKMKRQTSSEKASGWPFTSLLSRWRGGLCFKNAPSQEDLPHSLTPPIPGAKIAQFPSWAEQRAGQKNGTAGVNDPIRLAPDPGAKLASLVAIETGTLGPICPDPPSGVHVPHKKIFFFSALPDLRPDAQLQFFRMTARRWMSIMSWLIRLGWARS